MKKFEELIEAELSIVEGAMRAGLGGSKFVARSVKADRAEEEEGEIEADVGSDERKAARATNHNQAIFNKMLQHEDAEQKQADKSRARKFADKVIQHFHHKPDNEGSHG